MKNQQRQGCADVNLGFDQQQAQRSHRLGVLTLICSLSLCLTLGCTLGPDYHGVGAPALSPDYLNASSTTPRPDWHQFDDPTLNRLIARALSDSPDIAELNSRVVEACALVAIVAGQKQPFVDGQATYENRKRSSNSQPFVAQNADPFDFFSVGVDSRWEIDLFGRIARETEAASAEYQGTIEDVNDLKRLLIGEIARTYVQVRLYQEQLHQNQLNLRIQRQSLAKVRSRIEAGKVGRLDLVQLKSRISLTEANSPVFREQLKLSVNRLAVLVGTTPDRDFIEMIGTQPQLSAPLVGPGVPADLLRYRPDVRRAEREVAAASARIGVAESELYPKLALLGTISFDSRNVGDLISSDSLFYGIGPGFTWNLLSLGRIERQIEIQKAQLCQAVQRYRSTVLTAIGDVENSLASYQENTRRLLILGTAVDEAHEAVELANDQYEADRASLERVVSNQRRLLRASLERGLARADLATASVNLIQSAGIGWIEECTQSYPVSARSESVSQPAKQSIAETPLPKPAASLAKSQKTARRFVLPEEHVNANAARSGAKVRPTQRSNATASSVQAISVGARLGIPIPVQDDERNPESASNHRWGNFSKTQRKPNK